MKCRACGDEEQQRRIGPIVYAEHIAYRCERCDGLYAALEDE